MPTTPYHYICRHGGKLHTFNTMTQQRDFINNLIGCPALSLQVMKNHYSRPPRSMSAVGHILHAFGARREVV